MASKPVVDMSLFNIDLLHINLCIKFVVCLIREEAAVRLEMKWAEES